MADRIPPPPLFTNVGFHHRAGGIGLHGHDRDWEFHLVMKGRGRVANGGVRGIYGPGTLLCSRPGEAHRFDQEEGRKELAFYFFTFHPGEELTRALDHLHRLFVVPKAVDLPSHRLTAEEIILRWRAVDPMLKASAEHLFRAFVFGLAAQSPVRPDGSRDMTLVREAVRWVEDPANRHRGLDPLAEKLGVSKHHLVRVFTRKMGRAPLRYGAMVAVDTACDLLHTTDLSVRAIAESLGYEDEYYFSRLFKKQTGVAPKLWRERPGPMGGSRGSN